MATTEYLPVSFFPQGSGPPPADRTQSKAHRQSNKKQVNHELASQNAYMARHMMCYILRQESIRVSGLTDGHDTTSPAMNEANFVEARLIMERMCTRLLADHGDEVLGMIRGLDISDARLYGEFHKGAIQIVKSGVNPGRIAGLFLFAGLLAVRLNEEGQQLKKIRSLVEWLNDILNEYLTDWLQGINGWGGIKSCMQEAAANRLSQRQPAVTPAQPVEERHKWMAWAAVGVGAFVVGALLSR